MSLWLIGVVCVKGVGSLLTIFWFILRLLVLFFFFLPVDLGCLGLCLDEYLICMLVSGLLAVLEVLLFGRWCLCTFYGVYGGK
jgi:hypothetical protein